MKNGNNYLRTDIAEECRAGAGESIEGHGVSFREYNENGIRIARLEITSAEGEGIIGKPVGTYITVNTGKIWLEKPERADAVASVIASELKKLASKLCKNIDSVLVAGLGNRDITSDAIGPFTVKDVTVTRHIKTLDPKLFESLSSLSVSAVAPGVVGQTGIETVELIRGAMENVSPSLIVAVDALAAKSVDRLAATVQLSDTGLAPGSGIGNMRKAIDRENLGIPVISVGVPTVVDSSTLIYDVLERSGMTDIPDEIRAQLDNGRGFFVTLKDTDIAAKETAKLIARAINSAFSVTL